jgi:hypothetical protein
MFKVELINDNRARFIQRERFNGVLVPFFGRSLDTATKRGFKAMNEALKIRAEAA